MNAHLTDSDRQRIRAATARLAKQPTPAQIAASKRDRVLRIVADGPTQMRELCADLGAKGEEGRKQWEGVIRGMRRRGDIVIAHMPLTPARGVRVAPLKVIALPEHAGSLEVVA